MNKVSVILPLFSDKDPFLDVIISINNQIIKPIEIIIIDSSNNTNIQNLIKDFDCDINILYHWVPKAYPGHARNIGSKLAKGEFLAFIDSKTIPKSNWISDYLEEIMQNNLDFKIGLTEFTGVNFMQKIINAATYGKLCFFTIPGSIFKKFFFINSGGFIKHLRSGEDQHYLRQIGFFEASKFSSSGYLIYKHLPDNLFAIFKKYFIYSFYTSVSNIQILTKNTYLILFLMFSSLIFTSFKQLLPYIYTNLLLSYKVLLSSLFFIILYNFIPIIYNEIKNKLAFIKIVLIVVLFTFSIIIYNWNMFFANWIETKASYIPHITKYYIIFLLLIYIIFRGIILPLNKKVELKFIFPLNWIRIGLITFFIDIIKSPAYIVGAIIFPYIQIYYYLINRKNL